MLLEKEFSKILIITIFNYTIYGYHRYFLERYIDFPSYIKVFKFIIGFIKNLSFWIGIFFILSLSFKNRIKRILVNIVILVTILLGIIELFLIEKFDCIMNNTVGQLLIETNLKEGKEFISSYLKMGDILYIIIVIILLWVVGKIKIKNNNKKFLILVLIFSFIEILDFNNLKHSSLYRTIESFQNSFQNIKVSNQLAQKMNNNITINKNNSQIRNIVVIIGESTNRGHMSLYGYCKRTNPLLEKLKKNVYIFKDVISPHARTIPSLEKVLTFYNSEDSKQWYENNNIIDVMKKAGYDTYWFSNQEAFGIFGNTISTIAKRSDKVIFNKIRDSEDEFDNVFDEQIVEKSKNYLENQNKKFVVYHLMGTHLMYNKRYPKEFNKFKVEEYSEKKSIEKRKFISEYDNAILYNDYVLNKIIQLYAKEESIIFYLSDHGEEVYEFRDFKGHKEDSPSRYMLEIPFLIYLSDEFKKNYPEIEKSIEKALNKPYMTDDIIHTILNIANIETKEYDETRSIVSDKFNEKRERIYKGKSYDNYWRVIN